VGRAGDLAQMHASPEGQTLTQMGALTRVLLHGSDTGVDWGTDKLSGKGY